MDEHRYKIMVEYGVAACICLIGIFFIFQAMTIETSREVVGPRTMPLFLAITLTLGGIFLAGRAFFDKAGDLSAGYGFRESNLSRIFMIIGAGALFVLLFWAMGYFTALIITFIAMMLTFGVTSWPRMILGALVLALIFQWLFMGIMRLNDPKGAVIDMRPYTSWIAGN